MAQTDVAQTSSQTAAHGMPPDLYRRAGPGAFITSWRNVVYIIITLAALAYGWRVTQVDFVSLVVNLPKSERIFTGLMQPDVVTRVNETSSPQAPLQVGGTTAGQPSTTEIPGGGTLTVSPSPVQPGESLTISVSGARPNSDLTLLLDG